MQFEAVFDFFFSLWLAHYFMLNLLKRWSFLQALVLLSLSKSIYIMPRFCHSTYKKYLLYQVRVFSVYAQFGSCVSWKINSACQRFVADHLFSFIFLVLKYENGRYAWNAFVTKRHCLLSLKKNYINALEMASVLQMLCIAAVGKPDPLHFFLQ